jgi:hypothetical protein
MEAPDWRRQKEIRKEKRNSWFDCRVSDLNDGRQAFQGLHRRFTPFPRDVRDQKTGSNAPIVQIDLIGFECTYRLESIGPHDEL